MKLINLMLCSKTWSHCTNSTESSHTMDWGLHVELNADTLRICWYSCHASVKALAHLISFCCISLVFKSRWNDGENGKFSLEISFQFFLFILSLNSIHCVSSCYNPFNLISELMQNWWSHQDKFYIYMPFAIHNAYITTAIQMYRNLNVFTKNNDCL